MGNLDGFDPNTDCVADDQLQEIDRWALAALDDLIVNTSAGYAVYDFNKVYHAVYNFCVVAMSNFPGGRSTPFPPSKTIHDSRGLYHRTA